MIRFKHEHTTRDMKLKYQSVHLSEPIHFIHFNMRHPVVLERKIERQRSIQNIVVGDRSGGARFLRNTIQSVPRN